MRAALSVPYADAAATDLVLSLVADPRPSLASIRRTCPGGSVELHVLGASHQVVLDIGDRRLVEVVACSPGGGPEAVLPARAERVVDGLHHHFSGEVERLDAPAFAAAATRLEADLGADPDALIAVFPGRPTAVTAIRIERADATAVEWRSWHAYPQRSEIVATRTAVQLG